MKIFFILFVSSCLFAQAPIIYHSTFSINRSFWNLVGGGGNVDTITSLYGIHSKGEVKMLHFSINGLNELSLTKNLRLKAGRTYSFALYYNRVSGSIADTIGLRPDTIFHYPTTYSPGCAKIIVPSTPQGISDANWRKITFTETPTTTAPVYLAMRVTLYEESFIDSVVIRGDTVGDSFKFKYPASGTTYMFGDTVKIGWHTHFGGDSVLIRTPLGNYRTTDSTYNYIPIDSNRVFSIYGNIIGFPTYADTIKNLVSKASKFLQIDSVKIKNSYVSIYTLSYHVDSLKYYIRSKSTSKYLGTFPVSKKSIPNKSTEVFDISSFISTGDTIRYVTVTEPKDTVIHLTTKSYFFGHQFDGRISYYGAVIPPTVGGITDVFETGYVWDPCSGWCSGSFGYPGYIALAFDTTGGVPTWTQYTSSIMAHSCVYPPAPRLLEIDGSVMSEGTYFQQSGLIHSVYSQGTNTLTSGQYRYDFDLTRKMLTVTDLLAGKTFDYFDMTSLYETYGGSQPGLFNGTSIRMGAYTFPFEYVYNKLSSGTYYWSLRPCANDSIITDMRSTTSYAISKMVMPTKFYPMLIVQDNSGFRGTVDIPLVPANDHTAALTATYTFSSGHGSIRYNRNYFRGIYPEIKWIN